MSFINSLLRPLVDLLLAPWSSFAPAIGVTVVSLITALAILLVFKYTSNQKALEGVKQKIHAGLFEIRLYNDDFRAILRAQLDILRANVTYVRHSMAPMIWTLPPLVLLIGQMQFHYGYEGLPLGEPVLLKVELAESAYSPGSKPSIEIDVPAGLTLETPAVWIPTLGEMAWRLTADAPGDYELRIHGPSEMATKSVHAAGGIVRRSPFRIRGFWNEILYPAEAPLPPGEFESITVMYPEVDVDFFGLIEIHWMILYFILAMVFAFALRGPFGVTL